MGMEPCIREPYVDPQSQALISATGDVRRALFLDRDGVINIDHGYVHRPEQTTFLPHIFERVREAVSQDFLPIVVTNQAGIARGYYSENQFLEYTAWMHNVFAEQGIPLLATYWCPHHPQAGSGVLTVACGCRKPAPGMLLAAIARFGLDPGCSMLIGDKQSDIDAAHRAGVRNASLVAAAEEGSGLTPA